MDNATVTYLLDLLEASQDPLNFCAGSPVIMGASFNDLAQHLSVMTEVDKTKEEVLDIFMEQAKRFSACGANFSDQQTGVVRRNPETGWMYLVTLLLA
jgi:hypothetical protein